MAEIAKRLCYLARPSSLEALPLFVLSLPDDECDFDDLLPRILHIIDCEWFSGASDTKKFRYELLIFCASGHHRPSWPWLVQAFSKLDKKYKKALQRLYLVHEKSWVRVCMQLLENVVSPKFARKVRHVKTLASLHDLVGEAMHSISIPDKVLQYDQQNTREYARSRKVPKGAKSSSPGGNLRIPDLDVQTGIPSKSAPPTIPAPRANNRAIKQSALIYTDKSSIHDLPSVPPRRSSSTRKQEKKSTSQSSTIFEDIEDEIAADAASTKLQALLSQSIDERNVKSSSGNRSSSAPTVIHADPPRLQTTNKLQKHKTPTQLRRAISGPLTPSSSIKQNFLLPDPSKPPPKIRIHGKEVRVKTRKAKPGESRGKVGGLKALFEERALVAQSMV